MIALVASGCVLAAAPVSAVASSIVSATPDATSAIASAITSAIPSALASALPSTVTTTAPITSTTIHVAPGFEITAAFAGALAGALVGVRRQFDFIGIATLAVVAGLGGGIIRDVLLQKHGIYALENPRLLVAAMVAAAIGFFFSSMAERLTVPLFLVDAAALGLFAGIGTDKALAAELTFLPAILLGTITAVGGGILRDLLVDEVPQVLRPGGLYASAAVVGCVVYVLLAQWLNVVKPVASVACLLIVLALRLLSRALGWRSPTPTDLTPIVASVPKRAVHRGGQAISVIRRTARRGSHENPGEKREGPDP